MRRTNLKHFIFTLVTLFSLITLAQQSQDEARVQKVLQALNSRPEQWIEPIDQQSIKIVDGIGRADVNKKSKFSYYIHTVNPSDPKSDIILIPMATSRYTPTYYQTDDWWDANKAEMDKAKKEGRPAPRQDMNEVAAWLEQMKLSTNPLVFVIKGDGQVETPRLQDFLYQYYVNRFVKNGRITLFRGGEKVTETAEWLAGRKPKGVRYWTPTAAYAWRYARKNPNFLTDLIDGKAPLYVFDLSVSEFSEMVNRRWPRLTLGTELTKNAHNAFDRWGKFLDHLTGNQDFIGIGDIGVEFEIRSNSLGAEMMVNHFKRPISVEDLLQDRVQLLERTQERLIQADPKQKDAIQKNYATRIANAHLEAEIMIALREKRSQRHVRALLANLDYSHRELANTDRADLRQIAESRMADLPVEETKILRDPRAKGMSCHTLYL